MKTHTEEQIRQRAYEIYRKHGEPGRDAQNWIQAEWELNYFLTQSPCPTDRDPVE